MKLKLVFIALIMLSLACQEKKDNPAPSGGTAQTDPATTLPLKTWVFTGQTATTSTGTVDEYASLLACDKDDEYKFTALNTSGNGTFRFEEGATSCNGTPNALIYNGNWRLSAGKDSLFLTQNGTVVASKYKVKTMTGNSLVIELKGFSGSVEALYTYTYKAK